MPEAPQTLNQVRTSWEAGNHPDFHVNENMTLREGDRIVVIAGEHLGRHGRVTLTYHSDHQIIVRMVGLRRGDVRVTLDRNELGSWSGVVTEESIRTTRLETDAELYARVEEAYEKWGGFLSHAKECSGKALDDAARHLGLVRQEVTISDAERWPDGFHEQ